MEKEGREKLIRKVSRGFRREESRTSPAVRPLDPQIWPDFTFDGSRTTVIIHRLKRIPTNKYLFTKVGKIEKRGRR